jgi:hypothetical protein
MLCSIVGIDAGSGSDGCSGGDKCMHACQALCCIQDGCNFAEVSTAPLSAFHEGTKDSREFPLVEPCHRGETQYVMIDDFEYRF